MSTTDPLIGRTVQQYEIVARIGGGGMGVVYRATDTRLGRVVALKFLPPQWSHDEGAKQRFLREAQAASATNHRNICVIHDIGQTDDGQLFIVMAYYEGRTLKQTLERGALPLAEALEIAAEVAEGLTKAHAQGVVHRDIKPANLMLTEDGVKVLDFGLAKFADSLQLTMPGSTVGTAAYMSPEQARGEEADAPSDVWALGVVMYQMLCGRVPFAGTYPEATFHAIKSEPAPPLDGAIPAAVQALVLRALEKEPERRYQTAREMARDLRLLQGRTVPLDLRTEPVQAPPARPPEPVSWPRRARHAVTPARAMAAVAVTAVLAGGLYMWVTRPIVRILVAVAPVANHTGEPELDAYRMALTGELIAELEESPNLRVVPYSRLLEIVSSFFGEGDVSSTAAIQAMTSASGARFVVVPSLEYRNATWLGRVQIRSVETGTVTDTYETTPVTSSLPKDTALRQAALLSERVQEHFRANGPGRAYSARPAAARFRTLDAARAFEEGLRAYHELEYTEALDAFRRAASLDDQHAVAHAWMGRTLLLLYRRNEAAASGRRAKQLVTAETPVGDRLFVDAVLSETLGDVEAAERAYRDRAGARPDDPVARAELAEFLRRADRNVEAVEAYHEVLGLDGGDIWAHVQLCQLYTRLAEYPLAEEEAGTALERYRVVSHRGGEAQALLCLGEAQRIQAGARLPEARSNVAAAAALFETFGRPFNLSRAAQYQGLVEYSAGRFAEAAGFFQDAAARSATVGNRLIEGVALMNLGVTSRQLGRPANALAYLRQSRDVFEQIGIERRAAEADMNVAGLQVEFGVDVDEAVRRLANARVTLEKLGYVDFQVSAMDLEATALRNAGYLTEARRLLQEALSIARVRQLSNESDAITLSVAQTSMALNEYETARRSLEEAVASDGAATVDAQIALGIVEGRLGEFDTARTHLEAALQAAGPNQYALYLATVQTALGEIAYEAGRTEDARAHFEQSAALWTDELPDAASVEARAFLALLDARAGSSAVEAARTTVMQAGRMGRFDLEARCRVRLARLEILNGRPGDALATLDEIPLDGDRTLGPELRAQVHYWRSQALSARGNRSEAASEAALAAMVMTELQASLPPAARERFARRAGIRPVLALAAGPEVPLTSSSRETSDAVR